MDSVLVDTDVFSFTFKNHPIAAKYERHLDGKLVTLSFVSVAELLQGAMLDNWGPPKTSRLNAAIRATVVVPYDDEICKVYASLTVALRAQRIANNDQWIAATAIRHGIPLVSHNRKHYDRVPGLTLISESPTTSKT